MAEGVVSFGVQKLWEFLSRESERLKGVDEQIIELKRELGMLQSLLRDADAKKNENERVRIFLEDVNDIVYDAEDIIETFLLKEVQGKQKGIKKHVKRLANFLVDRRKFASDIELITKRIKMVIGRMQNFGIQQFIDGGHSFSLQERQRDLRQTFSNNSESDLVGVEQSVEKLVGHLVENDNIQVVSISGMGGIGKTTLARQVFHHDIVRRHFDGFVWVCVSQQFTRKHVWQRILQDLMPNDGDISHMDEHTLQGKLFQLLETGKYLVVLDDVWNEEDWDRIKAVFPKRTGWKMLLTSRNESVGLHADPTCIAFRPRVLTLEESWKLCQSMVFPKRDQTELRVDQEIEVMGKEMVAYCGGLPLAVKVLGGLLAKKHTVLEWKRVHDNIGTQIVGKPGLDGNNLNSVLRILSLSYEDLSMHLKHCFLYLSCFPEDYMIDVERLFHYWASEGMIVPYEGTTIRESGEDFLEELVRRNMVIAERSYSTSKFELCQLHDMMREVCLSKAKEENFLQVVKVPISSSPINAQSPRESRRFVVHGANALHILGQKKNQRVRSLLSSGFRENAWIQSVRGFPSLPMLRVLDLCWVKFEGGLVPSSIGELIHLRFLCLAQAWVSHLPSSLRKLKLLRYLNLYVNNSQAVHVPNVLNEMLELRYLNLPWSMHEKTKLELGDLVNLEALCYFSTEHCSVTDLIRMAKLRELSLCYSGGCTYENLWSSLHKLRNIEKLCLYDLQKVHVDHGGESLLDFIRLRELRLEMHMPRFHDQHRLPPYLAYIYLYKCSMEEDPMPILEKLLHLKSVVLKCGAFVGRKMVCSKGGFPQLCALELSKQMELQEWTIEEGSMPSLRTLTIKRCLMLNELPDGLKYITSMKELRMKGMTKVLKEKLVPSGEDYFKVQHIPSVQYIKCDVQILTINISRRASESLPAIDCE